jgi:hypothetical protein
MVPDRHLGRHRPDQHRGTVDADGTTGITAREKMASWVPRWSLILGKTFRITEAIIVPVGLLGRVPQAPPGEGPRHIGRFMISVAPRGRVLMEPPGWKPTQSVRKAAICIPLGRVPQAPPGK